MILPVAHEAAQQIGATQEGAVFGRLCADDDVIAAAGAGVAAIDHEFLRAEAGLAGFFIKRLGDEDHFVPAFRGLHVHLDHAGVWRDFERVHTRIVGRGIAFEHDGLAQSERHVLHGTDAAQILLQSLGWRHEDEQFAIARLDAESGAHDLFGRLAQNGRLIGRIDEKAVWGLFAVFSGFIAQTVARAQIGVSAALADFLPKRGRNARKPAHEVLSGWQRGSFLHRVLLVDVGIVGGFDPRLRIQRQTQADGRVAGVEVAAFRAQEPRAGLPTAARRFERQDVADDFVEALLEDLGEAFAFLDVFEVRVMRIDVHRQFALAP